MIRYWSTLFMFIVLAGLGGYLYLVEFPAKQREEKQESQQKQLLPFPETAITGLSITTAQGPVEFKLTEPGKWSIVAPLQTDADNREVQALIRALVTGTVTRTVEEQATQLAPFGLEQPVTTLTITAGTQQETISIGDSGPLSNTLYVLRASDKRVLLTNLAPRDFINKSLMTFRRKELLRFVQNDVERVRLTYPTTEIVIDNMTKDKPRPSWKIRYPIEAEADQNEVRSLMFRLEDLKALGIIDPGPERDTVAKTLTTPKVKVTLHTTAGDQSVRLLSTGPSERGGHRGDHRRRPALSHQPRTDQRPHERTLPSPGQTTARPRLHRHCHVVGENERASVCLDQSDRRVGARRPAHREISQEAADLFVSRVANLPAEERVMKQSAPLAPYGLLAPAAEFVATGKDGKTTGKLTLGNQAGNLRYATGHRLQGVFQVRPDLLTQIPSKADLLKKAQANDSTSR